jgi:hypothetical protein
MKVSNHLGLEDNMAEQKITRGNASQFFVAGELCRRGYSAVVTLGNTPNTDILCSNLEGTKFVHIQVKTFIPGGRSCSVGKKAEKTYGDNFFWVLGGIPHVGNELEFGYYIIPSKIMAENTKKDHSNWFNALGKKGQKRNETDVRMVHLPPHKSPSGWDISEYKNRWDLIEEKLKNYEIN